MVRQCLNGKWELDYKQQGQGSLVNISPKLLAEVPGEVHLDLEREGVIKDPFKNFEAQECSWMEEQEWWYRKTFIPHKDLDGKQVEIVFEGLDTFATIFLNGHKLGSHANMYTPCIVDGTKHLVFNQENELVVYFASPLTAVAGYHVEHLECANNTHERIYARKMDMGYGWDFGVRLVTVGIWKDVYLKGIDTVESKDAFIYSELKNGYANLHLEYRLINYVAHEVKTKITLELSGIGFDHELRTEYEYLLLPREERKIKEVLRVDQPKLWWPHTIGEPHLYYLKTEVKNEAERLLSGFQQRIGFREVRLLMQEKGDNRFIFEINGQKVFVKGANWIVPDAIPARVSKEKYGELIERAVEANMNMFRIWAGGIIESRHFYEFCSEKGIMVWQDFPYTCSDYPESEEFLEVAREEAEVIVKSLRNYPSLVFWNGNNENLWQYKYGQVIYKEVLPEVCRRLDGTRPYWPGSPFGGYYPNSREAGNHHNWEVWHEQKPYQAYAEDDSRFISEYGLQGSCHLATLRRGIGDEYLKDTALWQNYNQCKGKMDFSEASVAIHNYQNVIEFHNAVFKKLNCYTVDWGEVKNVKDFVFYTQLAQATGIKFGIEHFRRRKYKCGGSLFWQYNDIWPSVSWSCIDYELRPKLLYYYAKKAYAPVAVSFNKSGHKVEVWGVNDDLQPFQGELQILLLGFNGNILEQKKIKIELAADSAEKLTQIKTEEFSGEKTFLYAALYRAQEMVSNNFYYFLPYSKLHLAETKLDWRVQKVEREKNITKIDLVIKSAHLARGVFLDSESGVLVTDDNGFDLPANQERRVNLKIQDFEGGLTIKALNSPEQEIIIKSS